MSTAGLELKGRIDQLTGELEEFELRTRDEIIRRATEATLKAVGLELSKRDAQYNELHQTVATASTSLKRRVDELSASLEGVQATQEELTKTQELVDQSGKRIDALDKRLSAAPDGDVLGRQVNAMLTQALAARDTRIEAVEARLQTLPEGDTLVRRVKATMSEALSGRDARVQELRDTLASAAKAIEVLEQKVAAAPAAEVFDERVTAAENRLTESQRKVVAAQQLLKRQLDQLTAGLTGVQTTLKDMPDENEVNRRVRGAVVETVTDALVARDTQVQELREAQGRDRMGLEALEARVGTLADRDEIVRATNTTMSEAFTPRDRRLKKVESDVSEASKALERRFEDHSGALQRRIDELAGKLIALESRVSDMPDEEELVRSMGQIVARALSGEMIAQTPTNARRPADQGASGQDRGQERERARAEPRRPER